MKKHTYRGLASVFLAVLVIFGLLSNIANSWSGKVNELLGVSDAAFPRSDDPDDYAYRSDFENGSELIDAEIALNTRIEAEGAVALKGQPKIGGTKVTLFGMRSGADMQFGGSMGSLIENSQVVTLDKALEEHGFSVNPDMVKFYEDMDESYAPKKSEGGNVIDEAKGSTIGEVPQSEYSAVNTDSMKEFSDAAIIVLGRDAGESACFFPGEEGMEDPDEFKNSVTGNILGLTDDERDMVRYAESQGFKKIVVLINSAVPMELDELKKDENIDSILWIGNLGAYGTYGIAQLLAGEVLPSGHLTDTYAVNNAKSPAAQNYGIFLFDNEDAIETTNNNALRASWYLVEEEGIYTGYKYYETRYADAVLGRGNASTATAAETSDGSSVWDYDHEVSWSFGYGIEGSTFSEEITDMDIDWSGEKDSTVKVKVTNTGDQAAKHAVQLYVSVPYTDEDAQRSLEKSAIQLAGYAKTGETDEKTYDDVVLLEPGKSEEVTVTFNAADLYSYDRTFEHDGVTGAYTLEAGDYVFATGNGAHDALNAVLKAQYPDQAAAVDDPTGATAVETVGETLTITESNGTVIQNELTDGDLNQYGANKSAEYLSRSDWTGTFPQAVTGLQATDEMITLLRNESYDQDEENAAYDGEKSFKENAKNGSEALNLAGLDYDDPKFEEVIDNVPLEDLVNSYISYLEAVPEIGMPKELRADSPLGLIGKIGQYTQGSIYEVAEDDPAYGHFTDVYAGEPVIASTFSHLLASEEGRLIGNDSLWTGYNAWYAPGLNLHRTPYNGRNVEYYSEDAVLTGHMATDVLLGVKKYGLVVNSKHFAFNDQEVNRDGIAVFLNEQAGRENELRGFQIAFRNKGLTGIMTAFNRLGCTHVSADRNLMNGIVRGEWGFQGQIITDAVKSAQYFLPREDLMAGNNEMLGGSNNGEVWNINADAVKADPVIWNGIREAYHHKLYTYVNSNLLNGVKEGSNVAGKIPFWVVILQVLMGIGFAGFVWCLFRYVQAMRRENTAASADKRRK